MCVEGAEWAWWIWARLEDRIQAIYGKEALMDIGDIGVVGAVQCVGTDDRLRDTSRTSANRRRREHDAI